MVLFNYSTKELTAKIVYYGPGLCGKTTNLQFIFESLPDEKRGRMLSLSTQTDRTLYFDFLPMDLGEIRGMKTRIQLYTVPGQVFYNETRKMVLKGVDGVVFVADSQTQMADANLESFRNLMENLELHGVDPTTIPTVLQFNKRDLPSILTVEEMNAALNRFNSPFYEAIATTGIGVHDTLKAISKLVLRALSGRTKEDDHVAPPPVEKESPVAAPATVAPVPDPSPPVPQPPPAASAEWNEDSLDGQLDRMDAAEIEGLLQEVDGFDLDDDGMEDIPPLAASAGDGLTVGDGSRRGEPLVARLDDPLGNAASDDLSFDDIDVPNHLDEPTAGLSPDSQEIEPPAPVASPPPVGINAPGVCPPGEGIATSTPSADEPAELTLESFLAEGDGPATPSTDLTDVALSEDGEVRVPISMNIEGRTVRYLLTLRLQSEDVAPRR